MGWRQNWGVGVFVVVVGSWCPWPRVQTQAGVPGAALGAEGLVSTEVEGWVSTTARSEEIRRRVFRDLLEVVYNPTYAMRPEPLRPRLAGATKVHMGLLRQPVRAWRRHISNPRPATAGRLTMEASHTSG